jgi:hypothetical protein
MTAPKAAKAPKTGVSPAVLTKGRPSRAPSNAKTSSVTTAAPRALPKNPKLVARLQGMLPVGLTVDQAATGFRNQGQFVAAVNVSKNLGIPFSDLKAGMVGEGLSLGQAIQRFKPSADVEIETARATRWADKQLEPR